MRDESAESASRAAFRSDYESDQLDRTIQLLFGIGLKLEYSMDLVEESPDQARVAIDSSISGLGNVIDELRQLMNRKTA